LINKNPPAPFVKGGKKYLLFAKGIRNNLPLFKEGIYTLTNTTFFN
jgi:hypothetical protein